MKMNTKTEAAVLIAGIGAVIEAALGLVVILGFDLSAEAVGGVVTGATSLLTVIVGFFIRGQVFSRATVENLVTVSDPDIELPEITEP